MSRLMIDFPDERAMLDWFEAVAEGGFFGNRAFAGSLYVCAHQQTTCPWNMTYRIHRADGTPLMNRDGSRVRAWSTMEAAQAEIDRLRGEAERLADVGVRVADALDDPRGRQTYVVKRKRDGGRFLRAVTRIEESVEVVTFPHGKEADNA